MATGRALTKGLRVVVVSPFQVLDGRRYYPGDRGVVLRVYPLHLTDPGEAVRHAEVQMQKDAGTVQVPTDYFAPVQ